ncbi:hypothetical protein, partial [Escherichia coli]|uniref:hypothetical protein n=1 Tax=Escherichia coli TaxID=562 RepID=UPI001BC84E0E
LGLPMREYGTAKHQIYRADMAQLVERTLGNCYNPTATLDINTISLLNALPIKTEFAWRQ